MIVLHAGHVRALPTVRPGSSGRGSRRPGEAVDVVEHAAPVVPDHKYGRPRPLRAPDQCVDHAEQARLAQGRWRPGGRSERGARRSHPAASLPRRPGRGRPGRRGHAEARDRSRSAASQGSAPSTGTTGCARPARSRCRRGSCRGRGARAIRRSTSSPSGVREAVEHRRDVRRAEPGEGVLRAGERVVRTPAHHVEHVRQASTEVGGEVVVEEREVRGEVPQAVAELAVCIMMARSGANPASCCAISTPSIAPPR